MSNITPVFEAIYGEVWATLAHKEGHRKKHPLSAPAKRSSKVPLSPELLDLLEPTPMRFGDILQKVRDAGLDMSRQRVKDTLVRMRSAGYVEGVVDKNHILWTKV